MIVAVTGVRMMQMPIDQVVDVVTVRDRLMPTPGAVLVSRFIPCSRSTVRGVLLIDRDLVLVDVILVRVMQMPVMQVVGVPVVAYGDVPATGAVLVIMGRMGQMLGLGHGSSFG